MGKTWVHGKVHISFVQQEWERMSVSEWVSVETQCADYDFCSAPVEDWGVLSGFIIW